MTTNKPRKPTGNEQLAAMGLVLNNGRAVPVPVPTVPIPAVPASLPSILPRLSEVPSRPDKGTPDTQPLPVTPHIRAPASTYYKTSFLWRIFHRGRHRKPIFRPGKGRLIQLNRHY